MIRINLLKVKKRQPLNVLSLKVPTLKLDFIKSGEKPVVILPLLLGIIILIIEGLYFYNLSSEENRLRMELENLVREKKALELRLRERKRREESLRVKVEELRRRIEDIDAQKGLLINTKYKRENFIAQFESIISDVPGHIWFKNMRQRLSDSGFNIEISAGSYDIKSMLGFVDSLREKYGQVNIGEIAKRENEHGIIYYTTAISIVVEAELGN